MVDHPFVLDGVVGEAGQIDHVLARAAAGQADVGLARLARAVDDAAEHRERQGRVDMLEPLFQRLNGADDVEALARAAGAGDDLDPAGADAQRLQDLVADPHFLFRFGGERDADGVADAGPEQVADADRALDRTADQAARLGDAEVERTVDRFGELHIGGDREEHVAGLHRDLIFVEILVLEQLDMVERALDQRFGAGLAIFFEQILFQAASIHADADRAAVRLGRVHHFLDARLAADVAGVDAQAGRARIGGFERALIVEMDVGDDRHAGGADDLLQGRGRFLVGAGDADDVHAHLLAAADLVDRRTHIMSRRVGHGLHRDGRAAADGDVADHDLAALAAGDVPPGTQAGIVIGHEKGLRWLRSPL